MEKRRLTVETMIGLAAEDMPKTMLWLLAMFGFSLVGVKMGDRMKVGILYVITMVLMLIGMDGTIALAGMLLMDFFILEVFSQDMGKVQNLRLYGKIADFFFSMLFECHVLLFAAVCLLTGYTGGVISSCGGGAGFMHDYICESPSRAAANVAIIDIVIIASILCFLAAPKFLRKSYSEVLPRIDKKLRKKRRIPEREIVKIGLVRGEKCRIRRRGYVRLICFIGGRRFSGEDSRKGTWRLVEGEIRRFEEGENNVDRRRKIW